MNEVRDNPISDCLARWRSRRDAEALGELLKWQRDRAYATAYRILGNGTDAEDAVQQAFVKVMSRTTGFAGADEFKLTVYRAVVQCALDMARANRVRSKLEQAMSQIEKNAAPQSPQSSAEKAEAVKLVFEELAQLPEQERAIVVLCYQEGLSVGDAAELMDVPRETLRARLSRIMDDLRGRVRRRGVALSLLLLIGALKGGSALAAPSTLCEALDVTLPGRTCAAIPADAAASGANPLLSSGGLGITKTALGLAAAGILLLVGAHYALPPYPDHAKSQPAAANRPVSPAPPARTVVRLTPEARNNAPAADAAPAAQKPPQPDTNGRVDEAIALDALPENAREIASRAKKGIALVEAEKVTLNGRVTYEIKGDAGGKRYEMAITPDGKLLWVVEDDDQLPAIKPPTAPTPAGEF